MSWVETKLGDALKFYNGKAGKYEGGNYPVYGSNGLIGKSDTAIFDNGIIIGRVGAYCGAIQYCPSQFWASDNTIVVKNQDGYDIKCLAYLLEIMDLNQFAGGSAQPLLTHGWIKPISTKMPPLPIQQKIAGILSAYDDLIENNLKRIKLLEELAQITYEEWFVRLRFPGHETTPNNPETNLPEGWKQKQLADYFPIKTGKKDANIQTADGQYPFFTCSQGTYRTDVYSFDAEAIILAGNGEFNIKYYRGKFEAYQRNYVLIPNDSGFLFLLFLFMKHYLYQITAGSKGSVIKYLTKDMIANTKFHEPTISVLAAFNDIIVPVFYEVENLEKQNQRLREARDILLPRLMTGMIDVEQYDPAQLLQEAA